MSFLSADPLGHQVVALLGGYLLGSIPFGLLFTRMAGLGDVRQIGSGNVGATNVLRTGRKGLALATLLADGGKGAAAVLIAMQLSAGLAPLAAVAAVLGHNFPVWLKFKGGKGVATTLGVLLALFWPVGLIACAVWILIAALFRYSSLAALAALGTTPLAAFGLSDGKVVAVTVILAILGFLRHHANIRRLAAGTESKIGQKSQPAP